MNSTPRLRSAFPSTPPPSRRAREQSTPVASSALSKASSPQSQKELPVIPFNILDAPSQRLYVSLVYIGLTVWRLYDFSTLFLHDTDGFWLFTKWVGIDTAFLYGLSGLRIPWLHWSSSTFTVLFIVHGILNWMLMFRIPVPLFTWLGAFTKVLYDRELAVSEKSVKPASILHNSSLILGKQIIHILPEGSSMLNPDHLSFCIGAQKPSTSIPIRINQTTPIQIDLIRVDLETNANETITLSSKEIKRLKKHAEKDYSKNDHASPRTLQYQVKQAGIYRLQKVIDESKLEVQRGSSEAIVLQCPTASIGPAPQHKCKGDLSDFYLQVNATPPLKVKYSKTINRDDQGHTVLTLHPEHFVSPLVHQQTPGALIPQGFHKEVSWAKSQSISIPVNESLGVSGGWQYVLDEVQDASGNTANYSDMRSLESGHHKASKGQLEQHFSVHERPRIALRGCDTQTPLKVERGRLLSLPIHIDSTGAGKFDDPPYELLYLFTPQKDLLSDQKHASNAAMKGAHIRDIRHSFEIREPGLYSLVTINSKFCSGEVLEPSSCLLLNPPEPDLSITSAPIPDRCVGNSIGLLVDLDLLGTPPFHVFYTVALRGGGTTPKMLEVNHFHTQLELKPSHAGHYTYEFGRVSDSVYRDTRSVSHKNLILEQDVKPPPAARILDRDSPRRACIGEPATFIVQMLGEPPFKVEYEIVHNGRRTKRSLENIEERRTVLKTESLNEGGQYALALTSITDNSGCKSGLEDEVKIEVGLQRPRASFGRIDGKKDVSALEAAQVDLPVKLQGEAPWTLSYRNIGDPTGKIREKILRNSNDRIDVTAQGTYEILSLHDSTCPGSVDLDANKFSVRWMLRPSIRVAESPLIQRVQDKYVKEGVCQGDEDSVDILFTGTAPFNVEYEQRHKPRYGSQSMAVKKLSAGLDAASLQMETLQPGLYEYKFIKLGDSTYNHDHRKFTLLLVQQSVHPMPSASFTYPGKTYRYCQEEEEGDEVVPITLVGQPPFHLELEIKHQTVSKPEFINVPHIASNSYNLRIPHRVLALGTHSVLVRKVQDSRGCQQTMDVNAPHVQVSVADIPSISPLEEQSDYCVGDRISFSLSGSPPFNVFYNFQGHERKASVPNTDFRRIAEKPGVFLITAVGDSRSTNACKAKTNIAKTIHEMPSVRVSKGRTATVEIHEGGETEIQFDFGGTPPFHFTYTRSTNPTRHKKAEVLETKNEISHEHSKTVRASDEGVYEVVSIRDRYCAFSTQKAAGKLGQKLLTNR